MQQGDLQTLSRRLEDLVETVHDLNTEVSTLRRQLTRVQRRLVDVARPSPGEGSSAPSNFGPGPEAEQEAGEWTQVTDEEEEHLLGTGASRSRTSRASSGPGTPVTPPLVPTPTTPVATSAAATPRSPTPTPTSGGQTVPNWIQREAIADQIGQFLQRALQGDHRSSSGRDLVPLPSRLWIVCQDIHGGRYNPVRVFRSWTLTKALVKIGNEVGDSIFVWVFPLSVKQGGWCIRQDSTSLP